MNDNLTAIEGNVWALRVSLESLLARAEKAERDRDAALKRAEAAEAEVARLRDDLALARAVADKEKQRGDTMARRWQSLAESAKPYTPRVGDVVTPAPGAAHAGAEFIITEFDERSGWYRMGWLKADVDGTQHSMDDASSIHTLPLCYVRPATPAERAAAGLPVEPAAPRVLKEHLAWIEACAEHFAEGYNHPVNGIEPRMVAARALVAAVARLDGGGK